MKHVVLLLLLATTTLLPAQSNLFEAGAQVGISLIGGDLVKSDLGSVNQAGLVYGIMARRYFHDNVAVRLNIARTKLISQAQQFDHFGSQPVRSETPMTEISVDCEYDILGHQRNWLTKTGGVSPYAFLGLGIALTNPRLMYSFDNADLAADQNADVSKTRVVLPFGAGMRWNFSSEGSLCLEIGARPTFSDYLDGVSIAGNPNKNDWYGMGSVQFWYKISPSN